MTKRAPAGSEPPFTLGRDAFAQISAVEGLALGAASQAMFDAFDRENLGAAERRRIIAARHGVRAVEPVHGGPGAGGVGPSPHRRRTAP